jgi:hypothetical protein
MRAALDNECSSPSNSTLVFDITLQVTDSSSKNVNILPFLISADKKLNLRPILDCVSNATSSTLSSKLSDLGVTSSPGTNSRKFITSSSGILKNSLF